MMPLYLRQNDDYEHFGWGKALISKITRLYSKEGEVKFMGMFALNGPYGWTERPFPVFFQPTPPKGSTSYFAFGVNALQQTYICDGSSAFSKPIDGIIADDGEVIYSRFRHDYHTSKDQSVWVDGGRDYIRCSMIEESRRVKIVAQGSELIIQQRQL